jgi:threonine-phosphate decarboxylase
LRGSVVFPSEEREMTSLQEGDRVPAHGGQLRQLAAQFGIPQEDLLDFSANLNPFGPPESVLYSMWEVFSDTAYWKDYPDSGYTDLRSAFADYAGVLSSNIAISNGVIPLLEAAIRATKITKCLLPVPAFIEYRKVLERCGVEVVLFPLSPEGNFKIDLQQLHIQMRQHSCDALLFANPQNPSGAAMGREEVRRLLDQMAGLGAHVFLDEAFIDYIPEKSLTTWAPELSQVILFRSVTKFFALAGMRVAFAIANSILIARIEMFLSEWPVTTFAAMAAQFALRDQRFIRDTRQRNSEERIWLLDQLRTLGLTAYPGEANYLLFRMPAIVEGEHFWRRLILECHIVVRNCGNFDSLNRQFLRTAIRKRSENRELVEGLRALLTTSEPQSSLK